MIYLKIDGETGKGRFPQKVSIYFVFGGFTISLYMDAEDFQIFIFCPNLS